MFQPNFFLCLSSHEDHRRSSVMEFPGHCRRQLGGGEDEGGLCGVLGEGEGHSGLYLMIIQSRWRNDRTQAIATTVAYLDRSYQLLGQQVLPADKHTSTVLDDLNHNTVGHESDIWMQLSSRLHQTLFEGSQVLLRDFARLAWALSMLNRQQMPLDHPSGGMQANAHFLLQAPQDLSNIVCALDVDNNVLCWDLF